MIAVGWQYYSFGTAVPKTRFFAANPTAFRPPENAALRELGMDSVMNVTLAAVALATEAHAAAEAAGVVVIAVSIVSVVMAVALIVQGIVIVPVVLTVTAMVIVIAIVTLVVTVRMTVVVRMGWCE